MSISEDSFIQQYRIREYEENTNNGSYSFCISFLSFLCGYFLLSSGFSLQNQPNRQYYRSLHHRECIITLPLSLMFAIGFINIFILRTLYLFVFCVLPIKQQVYLQIFHLKLKRIEIMAGLIFFFIGSFILMLKEDCYELNIALLVSLIVTAFMILQICCYDVDPDDVIFDDFFDY